MGSIAGCRVSHLDPTPDATRTAPRHTRRPHRRSPPDAFYVGSRISARPEVAALVRDDNVRLALMECAPARMKLTNATVSRQNYVFASADFAACEAVLEPSFHASGRVSWRSRRSGLIVTQRDAQVLPDLNSALRTLDAWEPLGPPRALRNRPKMMPRFTAL